MPAAPSLSATTTRPSAAATIALAVRTGYMYASALTRARRQAKQHLRGLTLAGRRDPRLDALVVALGAELPDDLFDALEDLRPPRKHWLDFQRP